MGSIKVRRDQADMLLAEWELSMTKRAEAATEHAKELAACRAAFINFLPYWSFVGREMGEVFRMTECTSRHDSEEIDDGVVLLTTEGTKEIKKLQEHEVAPHSHLWEGQEEFARLTETEKWIFALKAGKLGFTELECAFDAWRMIFGPRNARIHIFSRADTAAIDLLGYVRFGIIRLPEWMRPALAEDERGGDTGHSLRLIYSEDDKRTAVCYAAGPKVSIDQTCHHAHVDEMSVMPFAEKTWNSITSTIAPSGTCHIVTRGAGDTVYAAELWRLAKKGLSKLFPFFIPYNRRPGRDEAWRETEAGNMTSVGIKHYAPETEDDALAGENEELFIPIELYDRCKEELPDLAPGGKEFGVLGVDAGVRNDYFAVVLVTRHPDEDRHEDIALRKLRLWTPPPGGEISFSGPEAFIWAVCLGGCAMGHWKKEPWDEPKDLRNDEPCPACVECVAGREAWLPPWNIFEVAYDPHQMENTAQRGKADAINFQPFEQGKARLIADSELRNIIASKRFAHDGNETMRGQIEHAGAKLDAEERKLRIVKLGPDKKVDAVVALSMAANRCTELYL